MEILLLGLEDNQADWMQSILEEIDSEVSIINPNENIFKDYVDLTLKDKNFSYIFIPDFVDKAKISGFQLSMFLMEITPFAKIILLSNENDTYNNILESEPIYKIFKKPFNAKDILNILK